MIRSFHVPLTQRTHVLFLACLVCTGHGRKVQPEIAQITGEQAGETDSLQALAKVLVGFNDKDGKPPAFNVHGRHLVSKVRTVGKRVKMAESATKLESSVDSKADAPEKDQRRGTKSQLDHDEDFKLTLRIRRLFQSFDTDGDGILDRDEAKAYFAEVVHYLKDDPRFRKSPEKIKELLKRGSNLEDEQGYDIGEVVEVMDGNHEAWWRVRIEDKNLDGTYAGFVEEKGLHWPRIEPRFMRKVKTVEDLQRIELERQLQKAKAEELRLEIARTNLERRMAKEAKLDADRKAREAREKADIKRMMTRLTANEIKTELEDSAEKAEHVVQLEAEAAEMMGQLEEELAKELGTDVDGLEEMLDRQRLERAADSLKDIEVDLFDDDLM